MGRRGADMSLRGLIGIIGNQAAGRWYESLWRIPVMTTFHMVLVSSDQSREPVDGQHADLDSACRKAFQIADEAARPGWRTGTARPLRVNVNRGDEFELSIEVAHDRRLSS